MHLRQVVLKNKIPIFLCVFLWFKLRTPWGGSILEPGALFEQTRFRITRQCHIANFKQLSQAVREKIYSYILLVSTGSPWDMTILNKSGKGPLDNFKHLSKVVLKKQFFLNIFLGFSMVQTNDTWSRVILNKLGKGQPGNASSLISSV